MRVINQSTDFKKGDRVRYTGSGYPDLGTGTVTSLNANFVFVDYYGTGIGIATPAKELAKV
ncbi:hypothetical protein [Spirosoma foliorum]|uniref:Uncharacterized protein n=1 Tax=Spirosoma foliorum TaxID=2710596 RepID=A0A7G5H362_9BACT|nr:hypothetical protein [Spirosoma foliorum]QMW05554.1 hypothetical protein H3H32_12015 [Spirosoma foliorum]